MLLQLMEARQCANIKVLPHGPHSLTTKTSSIRGAVAHHKKSLSPPAWRTERTWQMLRDPMHAFTS